MHSVFQSLCNNCGFFFQHFHIFNGTFHISLVLTGFFVKFSKDFQLFVGFFLSNNLIIGIIVKKNSWKSNSFNNARKPKKRFTEFCIYKLHILTSLLMSSIAVNIFRTSLLAAFFASRQFCWTFSNINFESKYSSYSAIPSSWKSIKKNNKWFLRLAYYF